MTERKTIEKTICLDPQFLDDNIKNHICSKLKKEMLEKCDQNYGYIVSIDDNISILSNVVSPAGIGIFFRVRCIIETLMPKMDSIYEGKVCMVLSQGILIEVASHLKVFVPVAKMPGYSFEKDFYSTKKGQKINKGDKVKVKLDMIKYEKPNFSCLGKLI